MDSNGGGVPFTGQTDIQQTMCKEKTHRVTM